MKAVFFDLDGTLVDSRADLCAAVNHTRRDLGLEELETSEILVNIGLGARHLLVNSIPEKAADVDLLWGAFMVRYREHLLDLSTLYPGVADTLEVLSSRGWKMGVNTAKPSEATRTVLKHFGIDGFFGDAVIAGGDCDEMKPSAKPLFACAERMGHIITPADWMVGDNWTDVKCGINAGVKSAFCAFGFGTLQDAEYTVKIDSFAQLLEHLN